MDDIVPGAEDGVPGALRLERPAQLWPPPAVPLPPGITVMGQQTCVYRAVDSCGQTIDFLLSARREAAAPTRFFRRLLGQPHTVSPRTIAAELFQLAA